MLCCDLSIERSLSRFCFGAAATQVKTHRVMVLSVRAVETHNDVRLFDAEEPVLLLELKPPSPAMKKKLARAKESQGPEASETKIETARSEQSDQFGDADLQEGYDFLLDDAESRAVEEEDADDGENAAENALAQSAMSRAVSEGRPGTHSASDDIEGSAEAYIASSDEEQKEAVEREGNALKQLMTHSEMPIDGAKLQKASSHLEASQGMTPAEAAVEAALHVAVGNHKISQSDTGGHNSTSVTAAFAHVDSRRHSRHVGMRHVACGMWHELRNCQMGTGTHACMSHTSHACHVTTRVMTSS